MDQTRNLIEQAQAESLDKRRKAAETLRELLLRADHPNRGDKESLSEVMATLGLRFDDLPALREAAKKLIQYEQLISEQADRQDESHKAVRGLAAVDAWEKAEAERVAAEAKAKRDPHRAAFGNATRALQVITEARRDIINVRATWLALADGISRNEALDRLRRAPYEG